MEDYTSENDNVDIRKWAQQIREQKIEELKRKIAFKQEIKNSFKDANSTTVEGHLHVALSSVKLVEDICKLKDKLQILTR